MVSRSPITVPSAFQCPADVVAGFHSLEQQFLEAHDARGAFVIAHQITAQTLQDWMVRGHFLDNRLVADYLVAFANAYRQALADYESGNRPAVPACWLQSFDSSLGDQHLSVLQHLMLGINAHINHDLPHAVLEAGLNVHCPRCLSDHNRINDALSQVTCQVRDRVTMLYGRTLRFMNWICGSHIDRAVGLAFRRSRHHSWNLAQALASASCKEARAGVARLIGDRAVLAGRIILASKRAPAKCLAALYEVEPHSPFDSNLN